MKRVREIWFIDRERGGKVVAIVPVDHRMIRPSGVKA